jgi:hypothetical protein
MMQTNVSGNRSSRWALGFDNLAKLVLSFSCPAFADLRKGSGFDSLDQLRHDIVENADLTIVQAIRFVREQAGDFPEHDDAVFRRAALQCGVNIVEQGRALGIWHNRTP